jgi:diaminohydroxyphosphoribosylaminopyrimidine deaminase/5-amino-6-(5-phosphoribosylamino)uracil reductase
MSNDELSMRQALALARASIGLASPNPQVGCVLTRNDEILGEGAHVYDQLDHAEIVAIKAVRSAGHDIRGATAYVTLEPCSHHGRTGPCADALIAAGIARCLVATEDPNPQVSGRGVAKLRAAGIRVEVGLMQAEARALNDAFACSITLGRPFVTLKSALSVDGRIAPPPSSRIETAPFFLTGPAALAEVQQLRHSSDAILTGIGTVLADDPLLTDRTHLPRRRALMRLVLDRRLRTPVASKLVRSADGDLWIFCADDASPNRQAELQSAGVRVTRVPASVAGVDLHAVSRTLHEERLLSVLVEAGAGVNGAFLHAGLVDRAVLYYAEVELGREGVAFAQDGPTSFALQQQLTGVSTSQVGTDVCVAGYLRNPWPSDRRTTLVR